MRKIRHRRLRRKVSGTGECPRLAVFRSLNHMYVQLIDDTRGHTIAAASSLEKAVRKETEATEGAVPAKAVGALIASRAREKGVTEAVFDRGGHMFHGKVKELAEAAREAGLKV